MTTIVSEAPNWMYSYDSTPGTWTQILPRPSHVMPPSSTDEIHTVDQPQPRYAHQVVYNHLTRTVFLHGGNVGVKDATENAGEKGHKEERMDDLWQMTLARCAII